MKTTTLLKKHSPILNANGRTTRLNGQVYLIRSQRLGTITLADAEPMPQGGAPINLFDRTVLARQLRENVELNLIS